MSSNNIRELLKKNEELGRTKIDLNSTIISIVPFVIKEFKPGVYPGNYTIPAAPENGISHCLVTPAVTFVDRIDQPSLRVNVTSIEVAKAIVEDYYHAALGINDDKDARPGLFYVQGTYHENFEYLFPEELARARVQQKNWFLELVSIADDDFAKDRRHIVISDVQRYAAKALKFDRPWLLQVDDNIIEKTCPACFTVVHPKAIICATCKAVIDVERYKELKFAEA